MEEDDKDPYQVGGKSADVRVLIQIGRSVGTDIWCGDVGGYSPPGTGPGGFPGPGGAAIDWEAPVASGIQ